MNISRTPLERCQRTLGGIWFRQSMPGYEGGNRSHQEQDPASVTSQSGRLSVGHHASRERGRLAMRLSCYSYSLFALPRPFLAYGLLIYCRVGTAHHTILGTVGGAHPTCAHSLRGLRINQQPACAAIHFRQAAKYNRIAAGPGVFRGRFEIEGTILASHPPTQPCTPHKKYLPIGLHPKLFREMR